MAALDNSLSSLFFFSVNSSLKAISLLYEINTVASQNSSLTHSGTSDKSQNQQVPNDEAFSFEQWLATHTSSSK